MSRRVAWRCDREEPAEGVIGPGLRVGGIYLRAHMSVDGHLSDLPILTANVGYEG